MSEIQAELPPLEERPLLTFALFAYNQEEYIREAVEGAFAQTYEPLEVILSDDCSTDRTFKIMEEMAAEYTGNKKIILNRNEHNLGIYPHVQKVHEMSSGEIVVNAAGDDVSLPTRAEVIFKSFGGSDQNIFMVISNAMKITLEGRGIGLLNEGADKEVLCSSRSPLNINLPGVNGCTVAIHRKLIGSFPAGNSKILAEDVLLLRRALMLGSVKYTPDVLVRYRIGLGVSHKHPSLKVRARNYVRNVEDQVLRFEQLVDDMEFIGYPPSKEVIASLSDGLVKLNLKRDFFNEGRFISFFALFKFVSLKEWVCVLYVYLLSRR
ncbi:glycosyltransferase [Halomonas icarae]|uniref:Glycosyltransferase n=1 Tax=Halomonas icarae TaxID=2691040 RepID=A0A7X4VWJ6_9GAMM|nr:glycosyltransferase [Halomonas icarae]MDR5903014.1 glycosyltransferase [Halomonas icarae]NAW11571.1 glycosyltransferase [Halomonas icarae]